MLRAHTSAHQFELIQSGLDAFLCTGDVYRRDEIDRRFGNAMDLPIYCGVHYPIFHQTEGVRLFTLDELLAMTNDNVQSIQSIRTSEQQEYHSLAVAQAVGDNLKKTLSNLVGHLFGPVRQRWVECYFPFTHPSWELEIFFENEWLEVLGCGIIEQEILNAAGCGNRIGWAFGLGLERLAMILFDIPDIRLFWSNDSRFVSQFDVTKPLNQLKFKPFSKYPPCTKDISFWVGDTYTHTSFMDMIRNIAGDLVEHVSLIDTFTHPQTRRISKTYRIVYRSMERTMTNEEINILQEKLRIETERVLDVQLR
eukprot:gene6433-9326_t